MDLIKKTNIDFISKRNVFFITSFVVNVVGLISIFFVGIDYGIDFTGGTQISVRFQNNSAKTEEIRTALSSVGYSGAELKSFGKPGEYLIRVAASGNAAKVSADIVSKLQGTFKNDNIELLGD